MKFGYRDRIILLIVCVVVIFGIGIFVFIKPKWEKLNQNKQALETAQSTWDAKMREFEQIPVRQNSINQKYEKATEIAEEFSPELNSLELDEYLQNAFLNNDTFKQGEMEMRNSYSVSGNGTATLNYYYFTPDIVTYPLYEYADLDGSLEAAAAAARHDADILSARSAQSVGSGTATFTVLANRENAMALLDSIQKEAAAKKDAMLITSVALEECDFNENIEEAGEDTIEETYIDEETGEEMTRTVTVQTEGNAATAGLKKGYTEVTITYQIYYMQKPTQPDVGASYDSSIWNGDGWRTATTE